MTNDPNVQKTDGTPAQIAENEVVLMTKGVREQTAFRWKIEQLHREEKQLTGIENCQCRRKIA